MNQLIPLHSQTIDGNAVETVSARELHEFLESKQDFSTWIKNRIEKYEFVENQDYIMLHKKMELSKTGQMFLKSVMPIQAVLILMKLVYIKCISATQVVENQDFLVVTEKKVTMSSREIATLCDKRHDNVMADIRKMLNELGLYAPDFSGTYTTQVHRP